MWPRPISCARLVVLFFLLVQHHVMSSQAATMAQLKNQQHQTSTTLGQQQQQHHHVQSQLTQQHPQQQPAITTHPAGTSDTNTDHHLSTASQGLQVATPSSSSSASSTSSSSSPSPSQPAAHLPPAQFINDKEAAAAAVAQEVFKHFNTEDDLGETYQILTELKREANANNLLHPPPPPPPPTLLPLNSGASNNYRWNPFERSPYAPTPFNGIPVPPIAGIFPHMFGAFEGYPTPFPVTPRFMPIMSYPQPILVPYPFYMTPEMFYPGFSALSNGINDYEDAMSRGTSTVRRPSPNQHSSTTAAYSRNSPIYYVRLPPTPYMFMPSLGLGPTTPAMTGFPTMLPYQSLPSFPTFSSVFNVPINFLANGKPNSIYQIGGSPNDIQGALQYPSMATNFNNRLPPPLPPQPPSSSSSAGGYRPSSSLAHGYFNNNNNNSPPSNNYGPYPLSASASAQSATSSLQDSKLTSLKRPFYFNGRPEDIYILPNNFNSLYPSENGYY